MDLSYLQTQHLYQATHRLFSETLSIPLQKTGVEAPYPLENIFQDKYNPENEIFQKIEDLFLIGLVQPAVFENELAKNQQVDFEDIKEKKYEKGILIFAIDFKENQTPTRSQLASLTRMLNQVYNQFPTILVAKYDSENKNIANEFYPKIAISSTERLDYKQEWRVGEKIGKISMLKDIDIKKPHRGHLDILQQMQINYTNPKTNKLENEVTTFEELTAHWLKAFDTKILSKKFYTEIANWYFWAVENVEFPTYDGKTEQQVKEIACIRFITRLVFVWFLREKGLISEELFNEKHLKSILINFEPQLENPNNTGMFAQENQANKTEKNTHSYYNAILQNLFFATLNRPTDSRMFATDEGYLKNRTDNDMNMFYRYEKLFKNQDEKTIISYFDKIPFVNGGLFDSLDDKKNDRYIEGFTRIKGKQAKIPDYLLFDTGSKSFTDKLNTIYETKNKKYEVRGIIEILKNYKFTVEENTPLEQDVALDPDLLGQIFENLLAYYNPETGQTARKGTGSFYTPPEIVNYMVEESLLEFFVNNFKKESETEFTKQKFRELLTIENETSPFTESQNKQVLECIHTRLKILDPACGSGAFPMAILEKLVQLVRKLDPKNNFFANLVKAPIQKQIEEKKQEIEKNRDTINQITIEQIKQNALKELEEQLKNVESHFDETLKTNDYARKLHLIQNCIYGIDIQPIAVQITKLRFFLSLIIEQKPKFDEPNFGIETLPNLEIKFVAANTLIGLDKPKQLGIVSPRVIDIEDEIKKLRKSYFSLQNKTQKVKVQNEEEKLRKELGKLLQDAGWNTKSANQIAKFNIFDQTREATWFDVKMIFGIETGFGIVIGNPPYVRADSPAIAEQRELIKESNQYETLWEKWDLMVPFYENTLKLLDEKGVHSFVVSNSITTSKYAQLLQDWIIKNYGIISIDYFENIKTFDAGVVPVITIISKEKNKEFIEKKIRKDEFKNVEVIQVSLSSDIENLRASLFKKNFSDAFEPSVETEQLGDICYLSYGLRPNSDEKIAKGEFGKDDLISDTKTQINCKEYVEGKNVKAFVINKIKFLEWGTERAPSKFARSTFPDLYEGRKILRGRVTKGVIDDTGIICNDSIIVIKRFIDLKGVEERSISSSLAKNNLTEHNKNKKGASKKVAVRRRRKELEENSKNYSLEYILGIINSTYAMAYMNNFRRHRLENYFYPDDLRNFPIPKISDSSQQPFIVLVEKILALKKLGKSSLEEEKELDALVFDLYGLSEEERALVAR